ncbi:GrpB family protein [Halonatronum saccharophilum]|uniref:GrpB family protein n=1 Tax=Halonatronum saccharophilum TaxID=150060 RepID=UPI0004B8B878|nr:GrpB family protein [Halonatronum saccharophilum]
MTGPIKKVSAYILRETKRGYDELLVFSHKDYPEASLQIPGGTVDKSEDLEEAVKREVYEETGLKKFQIIKKLGEATHFKPYLGKEVNRHFFLIRVSTETPDSWEHKVEGEGEDEGLIFSYRWFHPQEVLLIHNQFHKFLTPKYIPTLFPKEVMLGLSNKKVSLVPYTKLWRGIFENERIIIEDVIGEWIESIEHIGSTSIPRIPAKPIIDIGIGVRGLKERNKVIISKLEGIGYQFRGECGVADRCYLVKGSPQRRTHYLHMHLSLKNYSLFRDYLTNRGDC